MAQKHITRESIHTGLSASKDDSKWSDLLNFRSVSNRTYAVAPKRKLFTRDAGFHTILHGVDNQNYAIGSKESWTFRGCDETSFVRLWRARVLQRVTTNDPCERLRVRGVYTGTQRKTYRLTAVAVADNPKVVWNAAPEPVEPTIPENSLFTGRVYKRPEVDILVVENDNGDTPMPGMRVQVIGGRFLVSDTITTPTGHTLVQLNEIGYVVQVSDPKRTTVSVPFQMVDYDTDLTVTLDKNIAITLYDLITENVLEGVLVEFRLDSDNSLIAQTLTSEIGVAVFVIPNTGVTYKIIALPNPNNYLSLTSTVNLTNGFGYTEQGISLPQITPVYTALRRTSVTISYKSALSAFDAQYAEFSVFINDKFLFSADWRDTAALGPVSESIQLDAEYDIWVAELVNAYHANPNQVVVRVPTQSGVTLSTQPKFTLSKFEEVPPPANTRQLVAGENIIDCLTLWP